VKLKPPPDVVNSLNRGSVGLGVPPTITPPDDVPTIAGSAVTAMVVPLGARAPLGNATPDTMIVVDCSPSAKSVVGLACTDAMLGRPDSVVPEAKAVVKLTDAELFALFPARSSTPLMEKV
jgi:hypothetical protein